MIIKPLLVLVGALILVWFLRSQGATQSSALKKIGSIAFFIFAVCAIVSPNFTNRIAHWVGVGRGADLLLYLLTLIFTGFLVGQYAHNKNEQVKINALARKLALYEANALESNKQKLHKQLGQHETAN